jgi:catechol 2,3-dioxygenase-like lactoylglutathione lyase family enzyme
MALEGTESASEVNANITVPGLHFGLGIDDFRNIDRKVLHSRVQDPGNSALSMVAEDLPALIKTLQAAGTQVETAGGEPVNLGQATRGIFVRDPNGILIELVERQP